MSKDSQKHRVIGIYGGTFDPPHLGHLGVAGYIVRKGFVDEVWMMVSPLNPLKVNKDISSDDDRIEMCRLLTAGIDKIKVSDFEFGLERPSYTIDTLRSLHENYPDFRFLLIIGEDNLDSLHLWKEPESILKEFGLIVYPRPGSNPGENKIPQGCRLLKEVKEMDISSTYIREMIKERRGKGIKGFPAELEGKLPEDIWDYIEERGLYI